jgi:hypothetical protein
MPLFDFYIMVDWSGGATRRGGRDTIWIAHSFDHLVGAGEQRLRDGHAERFGGFRFTTRSNLVGCSTGMLDGFVRCKILSTSSAACRNRSEYLGP